MIRSPAARYSMGSHQGALFPNEEPPHDVSLRTYYISEAEVSFDDYDRFAAATGRPRPDDQGWGRGRQPVVNVNWEDARAYTDWLSQQTGKRYRLPSEAEWEYAAAGASEGFYWWGYKLGYNNAVCFNCGSEWDARQPAPVKSLTPNEYGLHNTAGNVMEWVADCYHTNYHGAPADGSAWEEPNCALRVARGGAFNRPAEKLRTASRTRHDPQVRLNMLGFRVVREP
jgi:formylglycine-generating enzyme required for sulfatase activity